MNNIVGQPVEGEDFYDREDETSRLWEQLEQGNHVVLLAPRRVGKTSLAIRVGAEAVQHNWRFVLVDAQRDRDELGLLANLFENLKSAGLKVPILARLTEGVAWLRRSARGRVDGFGMSLELAGNGEEEAQTVENLINQLFEELERSEDRVLIAVDELPVLLTELNRDDETSARLRSFLNWFRGLRLRYRKNVRWLLLGSVGLDSFVEARNLTQTINDLQTASLGAYPEPVAIGFLQALGRDKGLTLHEDVCAAIIAEIGWPLPFFLQLVFQRIYWNLGRPPQQPTLNDVTTACEQLTRPDFYKHFEPWRGRLAEGLGPDEHRAAVAVLNALCTAREGRTRDHLRAAVAVRFPHDDHERCARLCLVSWSGTDIYYARQQNRAYLHDTHFVHFC